MAASGARDSKDVGMGLNLDALAAAARRAEGGEAYQEVSRNGTYRLGVIASLYPSDCVYYGIECTYRLFTSGAEVEPERLLRAAVVARSLQGRDYELAHLDDGWVSCEKLVRREEVAAELEFLRRHMTTAERTEKGEET